MTITRVQCSVVSKTNINNVHSSWFIGLDGGRGSVDAMNTDISI